MHLSIELFQGHSLKWIEVNAKKNGLGFQEFLFPIWVSYPIQESLCWILWAGKWVWKMIPSFKGSSQADMIMLAHTFAHRDMHTLLPAVWNFLQ